MLLQLIAVMIFLCVCFGGLALARAQNRRSLRDIVGGGDSGLDQSPTEPEDTTSYMDRWEQMAQQAGLPWKRNVYYFTVGTSLLLALGLTAAGQGLAGLLLAAGGLLGPHMYVRRQQVARQTKFREQLPQALFLAASVLRAGGTLLQAVDAIAGEMPAPMGEEFKRIQSAMRLQVPAHEAMAEAHVRIGVREFAAVIVAARITAEVGGNLAHVYEQVARSIVDALNARRAVLAFTTEGRMSANMITLLPFVVLGILHFVSPGYFGILFGTWTGRFLMAGCMGTIALGWFTIRKMVDIRPY